VEDEAAELKVVVADDVTDVVGLGRVQEHEIAGVELGIHADAVDHGVLVRAAELGRSQLVPEARDRNESDEGAEPAQDRGGA